MQELEEETKTEYKNTNELIAKYEKTKEYCRSLLFVKQKLQGQVEELSAAVKDLRDSKEKEKAAFAKEMQQMKTKNDHMLMELNVLRKKKHTALEDHKGIETPINTNLLIDSGEIEVLAPIGQGSSSVVYKAKYRETLVALKKMTITEERPQQAMVLSSHDSEL